MPKQPIPLPTSDMFLYDNPYGYKLRIYHPKIRELFKRFKQSKGLHSAFPVSDSERLEFEDQLFTYWRKKQAETLFKDIERRTEKST